MKNFSLNDFRCQRSFPVKKEKNICSARVVSTKKLPRESKFANRVRESLATLRPVFRVHAESVLPACEARQKAV